MKERVSVRGGNELADRQPKKKGRNPWSDSESGGGSASGSDLSDVIDEPIIPRETGSRRQAAAKIKYNFEEDSDDSEKSGSDLEMFDNSCWESAVRA